MADSHGVARPEGIFSLLDTDLYKLTMQNVILKYFKDTLVTYEFTNRTPAMKLNRAAFKWLEVQIKRLGNIQVSEDEIVWLRKTCPYLSEPYLGYLANLKLQPSTQVRCKFVPQADTDSDSDFGDVELHIEGLWVETILYEIPLLALTSEAYFKFCDRDWSYEGQASAAKAKGLRLLENGCTVSEFGSRRRRDLHTHELILQGLMEAQAEGTQRRLPGRISGTSNVHLARMFGIAPIGTMAHEWFMGVAAVTNSYSSATETALRYWIATFGKGVLGIALTDTFGTPQFLQAFKQVVPSFAVSDAGGATVSISSGSIGEPTTNTLSSTDPPIQTSTKESTDKPISTERYADVFTGTRQDSGNPLDFIKIMRDFYDNEGITGEKGIVFSDSLDVDRCIEYKEAAEKAGFRPSFGVGTFFTNDFVRASTGEKSAPLNIVIKISSANGKPAVKISDNIGKNTGDSETVENVKRELGYVEHVWEGGDERKRWNHSGAGKQL